MERDDHQKNNKEALIPLPHVKEESSPKNTTIGGDRVKRDEWSEGAVLSLLEVYEAKWALRNRAKLKGQDWEDVAKHVSSKACSNATSKSPKTPTQCKNKIESMKKRYRAETAGVGVGAGVGVEYVSSWPLFSRLHQLLGGASVSGGGDNCALPLTTTVGPTKNRPLPQVEEVIVVQPQPPLSMNIETTSLPLQLAKEERLNGNEAKLSEQVSDGAKSPTSMDTDSSIPVLYGCKNRNPNLNTKMKRKRRRISQNRDTDMIIAESIRWLAEAVVKSEQVRMETTKEMEKMRADAEAKRAEIELKKTEIIANTQLEIAKIFASSSSKNIGR